jgi:hypothetical protein
VSRQTALPVSEKRKADSCFALAKQRSQGREHLSFYEIKDLVTPDRFSAPRPRVFECGVSRQTALPVSEKRKATYVNNDLDIFLKKKSLKLGRICKTDYGGFKWAQQMSRMCFQG